MNAIERKKVQALAEKVRAPHFGYGMGLIKNLRWRMDNNSTAALSVKERYLLDLCCWHYRNKLGGLVDFELPEVKPELSDYYPQPKLQLQERLL